MQGTGKLRELTRVLYISNGQASPKYKLSKNLLSLAGLCQLTLYG